MRRTGAAEITLKTLPEMDRARAQEETSWIMRAQCWTSRAPTLLLVRPVTLRAKVSHPFCRFGYRFGLREVLQRTNSIGRLWSCMRPGLCSWTRAVCIPQEPAVVCVHRVVRIRWSSHLPRSTTGAALSSSGSWLGQWRGQPISHQPR